MSVAKDLLSLLAKREDAILVGLQNLRWNVSHPLSPNYLPIFQKYLEIHKEYAAAASSDLEALKRGLFIQWFAWIEPSALSGISDLDAGSMQEVAEVLNARLQSGDVDEELAWMLNHYVSVGEFAFDDFRHLKYLDAYVTAHTESNYPASINSDAMKLRGRMGKYWNSVSIFR